jgi:hypothetical protein
LRHADDVPNRVVFATSLVPDGIHHGDQAVESVMLSRRDVSRPGNIAIVARYAIRILGVDRFDEVFIDVVILGDR